MARFPRHPASSPTPAPDAPPARPSVAAGDHRALSCLALAVWFGGTVVLLVLGIWVLVRVLVG